MIETSSDLRCLSLEIFSNILKMLGKVCLAFGTILENLRKSSESGCKSLKNPQNWCYQYVYNVYNKKNIYVLVARIISHLFVALTREMSSSSHSNVKFISSRHLLLYIFNFLEL